MWLALCLSCGKCNRPFPSCLLPLRQKESCFETIHMKCFLTAGLFSYKSDCFSYERFCTNTHFENEAKGNSVMAYLIVGRKSVRFLLHSLVGRHFLCCVASPWVWLVCSPITYVFTVGIRIPLYCRLTNCSVFMVLDQIWVVKQREPVSRKTIR